MSFFDLPPKTLVLLGVLFAYMMIDELSIQEQNSLGNWLQVIGQILESNSAQASLQQSLLNQKKSQMIEQRLTRIEELLKEKS